MPPDVRDWLPEGHFAWFVLDTVAAVDLAEFYAAYREDGRSRPAYEPSMMVSCSMRVRHRTSAPSSALNARERKEKAITADPLSLAQKECDTNIGALHPWVDGDN